MTDEDAGEKETQKIPEYSGPERCCKYCERDFLPYDYITIATITTGPNTKIQLAFCQADPEDEILGQCLNIWCLENHQDVEAELRKYVP